MPGMRKKTGGDSAIRLVQRNRCSGSWTTGGVTLTKKTSDGLRKIDAGGVTLMQN